MNDRHLAWYNWRVQAGMEPIDVEVERLKARREQFRRIDLSSANGPTQLALLSYGAERQQPQRAERAYSVGPGLRQQASVDRTLLARIDTFERSGRGKVKSMLG